MWPKIIRVKLLRPRPRRLLRTSGWRTSGLFLRPQTQGYTKTFLLLPQKMTQTLEYMNVTRLTASLVLDVWLNWNVDGLRQVKTKNQESIIHNKQEKSETKLYFYGSLQTGRKAFSKRWCHNNHITQIRNSLLKFLLRIVNRKHLIHFQSQTSVFIQAQCGR